MRRAAAALLALAVAPAPALAGIPVTREMTCPIGGERFSFTTTASYSVFGARADGKPYGSWDFPLAIPECPGNGLVMYKDFDQAELTRIGAIIAGDDYRALRRDSTPYYRLHWLLGRMEAPREQVLWALIQATWEDPDQSPRRMRYLGEIATIALAETAAPASLPDYGLRAYGINALRELGRFEEADALLARTPLGPLRPEGTLAGADPRQRAGWLQHYTKLQTVLARRDRATVLAEFPER